MCFGKQKDIPRTDLEPVRQFVEIFSFLNSIQKDPREILFL
jgi:hypothetical protein